MDLITSHERLAALVDRILRDGAPIALDTEGNSRHRYPEQLCLVQVATDAIGVCVIDPLAIEDAEPFGRLMADDRIEKVIHSADYDVRSLDREWGFRVRNIFDTSIAARFMGAPRLALERVLEDTLGVQINKQKRLQQADWAIRPLSDEALGYAADDVAHLLRLRRVQGERLVELGRIAWVAEECARLEEIRFSSPEPPEVAYLSMKGSRDLGGRALAILREVFVFRDTEARRRHVPPYRIASNEALLFLALQPESKLTDAPGISDIAAKRLGTGLRAAIRAGLAADLVTRPRSPVPQDPRPTKEQLARFQALKAWRIREGERLGLDPSLIWPMASLERLSRAPEDFETEVASSTAVRQWQQTLFVASLRALLLED